LTDRSVERVQPGGQLLCSEDEARITVLYIVPAQFAVLTAYHDWEIITQIITGAHGLRFAHKTILSPFLEIRYFPL
jgi:hypothetical protein